MDDDGRSLVRAVLLNAMICNNLAAAKEWAAKQYDLPESLPVEISNQLDEFCVSEKESDLYEVGLQATKDNLLESSFSLAIVAWLVDAKVIGEFHSLAFVGDAESAALNPEERNALAPVVDLGWHVQQDSSEGLSSPDEISVVRSSWANFLRAFAARMAVVD